MEKRTVFQEMKPNFNQMPSHSLGVGILADNYSTPSDKSSDRLKAHHHSSLKKSIFTTPKVNSTEPKHPLTSSCLQDCTKWALGIQVIGPDGNK